MAIPNLGSKPFFDDKNRTFWTLQTAGWTFYLLLRLASGIGNGMKPAFIIPLIVSVATGYSITLVMSAVYRWLISRKPIVTWGGALLTFFMAVAA